MNTKNIKIREKTDEIISLYNKGNSMKKIADIVDCTTKMVFTILHENNVTLNNKYNWHKYKINQNYFDIIDTEEKAYMLGFIFADGHNNVRQYTIKLSLMASDSYILEKMNSFLQEKPIKIYTNNNGGKTAHLLICSKHISKQLLNIGVKPNKTYDCEFPDIAKHLEKHFIRGYFDGDGCVYLNNNKNKKPTYRCIIIGTLPFLQKQKLILENNNIKCTIDKQFVDKKDIVTRLNINSTTESTKFYNFIYNESTIYLSRKYNKFQEMFKQGNINNLL